MNPRRTTGKKRSGTDKSRDFLEALTPDEAKSVLAALVARDKRIARQVQELIETRISEIDVEAVAGDVQLALELIDVEDVWDRSGPTRDGYVEPGEMAWQMFEDELQPFRDRMLQYESLGMPEQAKLSCMGILYGIYLFEHESESEYKEWAADAPQEHFQRVLDDWSKSSKRKRDLGDVTAFIEKQCPDWHSRTMRALDRAK